VGARSPTVREGKHCQFLIADCRLKASCEVLLDKRAIKNRKSAIIIVQLAFVRASNTV
jgi:hypothetical protein